MDFQQEAKIIELFNKRKNTSILGIIQNDCSFSKQKIFVDEYVIEYFTLETSEKNTIVKIEKDGHVNFKDLLGIIKAIDKPQIYILLLSSKEKLEIYNFKDETNSLF